MMIKVRYIFKKLFTFTTVAAAVGLVAACRYDPLYAPGEPKREVAEIEVIFNWAKAPEANPKTMTVFFYPAEGGEPERYDFLQDSEGVMSGGKIKIKCGAYKVLCVNTDVDETIAFNHKEAFETFEITTKDQIRVGGVDALSSELPRATGFEDERVAEAPGVKLYSGHLPEITVATEAEKAALEAANEATNEAVNVVTLAPDPIVKEFTVELRNIKNLNSASTLSGSITSFIGGYLAGLGVYTQEHVTLMFDQVKADNSTVTGSFLTFGHCPMEEEHYSHTYTIYAILRDGQKKYHEFDVTDKLHGGAVVDPYKVIVEEGVELPDESELGGQTGLRPTVNEWSETVHIDPPMK